MNNELIQMKKQKDNWRNKYRQLRKDIVLVNGCLKFRLLSCDNKQCTNIACPLNKEYD